MAVTLTPVSGEDERITGMFKIAGTGTALDGCIVLPNVLLDPTTGLPTTSIGGGGGAATIADGADVTQGAKGDVAWNGTDASTTEMAVLKRLTLRGAKTLTTPSIGATSTLALAANPARKAALLTNPSSSVAVYIGPTGVTTTAYAICLPPGSPTGATYVDQDSSDAWYAVVASGTLAINVLEVA